MSTSYYFMSRRREYSSSNKYPKNKSSSIVIHYEVPKPILFVCTEFQLFSIPFSRIYVVCASNIIIFGQKVENEEIEDYEEKQNLRCMQNER